MKKAWIVWGIVCCVWGIGCSETSEEKPIVPEKTEVSLFDRAGKAVAYIDYLDEERPIYLWDGTPVAYIGEDDEIYHYNGQFLGWLSEGILFDRKGYAVVAEKGVSKGKIVLSTVHPESIKGTKQVKPVPHIRSLPTIKPVFRYQWSPIRNPLMVFFQQQVTLFDREKEAAAYIDYADESDEPTIYLWAGMPVAYMEEGEEEIYRFDGQFMGWYVDGIVYDRSGYAVGAENGVQRGEISMLSPRREPVKGIKKQKPSQKRKMEKTERPEWENRWSETLLTDFFQTE